jgi:hypothetical protein
MPALTPFFTDFCRRVRSPVETEVLPSLARMLSVGWNSEWVADAGSPNAPLRLPGFICYASPCPRFGLEARAQVLNYGSLRVHQSFEKIMVSTITMDDHRALNSFT